MKSILLPFGIASITGTNYYAVKLTANISKSNEVNLTDRYGLNVSPISRKDGKKSKAVKLTGVLNNEKVWDFLNELRLAIIDRKIGELYDARLAIIKQKHGIQECEQTKENFVKNPYAMSADKPSHVVGFIDLSKPSTADDDLFGDDDELPW